METRPSRWRSFTRLGVGGFVLFPGLLLMMVFNSAIGSGQVQAACSKITCSIPPSTLPDSSATAILPSLCKTSAVCPDRPLHRNTFNLCLSFFPPCVCLISDLLLARTDFYRWYLSGGSFVSLSEDMRAVSLPGERWRKWQCFRGKMLVWRLLMMLMDRFCLPEE